MSIGIEIGAGLSDEDATHFAAVSDAITAAMQRVRERHPAYNWVWTDEIRCRGCNASRYRCSPAQTLTPTKLSKHINLRSSMPSWLSADN